MKEKYNLDTNQQMVSYERRKISAPPSETRSFHTAKMSDPERVI